MDQQQPPQWAPPPNQPVGWGPTSYAGSSYPVDVRFNEEAPINRLWGIPLIGLFVRQILLILHFIVLLVLGIGVGLLFLISWLPILLNGRQASFVYAITGGYLRYAARALAYMSLLAGAWPPFALAEVPGEDTAVRIDEDQPINRLWGIPFIGVWVRAIILIPHFIVLWLLGIVAALLILVSWIPVLLNGRQASLFYQVVGGYIRYQTRVVAYLMLLSGPYPPFRLGS
jgi:hypothetical protein